MAIDWERVVVESDDNGVVVSAGQVSLLIGADADSVSWGNITGDITQQPDLMQIVDGYVSADSPTFTGTPRSVTPPEGNNSTRIATTAFVQGEMANVRRDVSDKVNEAPVNNHIWGRKDENWAQLGEMATVDEPAHGISSSVPQRFVRTKEPDGDMVWEEVGTMAMLDAPSSLTPNITYGLYNGEMVNIDPAPNGSATKKYWLRTNEVIKEGEHTGDRDPKWEEAGTMAMLDVPDSLTPNITYGLYNGEMVNIDPAPNGSATKKYWLRTNEVIKEGEHTGDRDPKWEEAGPLATVFPAKNNQTLFVNGRTGNDNTGTGGVNDPFKTIQKAIDVAPDYYWTTIQIAAGVYDENPQIDGKNIELYQTGDGTVTVNNIFVDKKGTLIITNNFSVNNQLLARNESTVKVNSEIYVGGNVWIEINSVCHLLTGMSTSESYCLNAINGGVIVVGQIIASSTETSAQVGLASDGGTIIFTKMPSGNYQKLGKEVDRGHVLALYNLNPPLNSDKVTDDCFRYKARYVRANEYRNGKEYAYWELVDEPPHNDSNSDKFYVRTSYKGNVENDEYKYNWGWKEFRYPPLVHMTGYAPRYAMTNNDNPQWVEIDEPPGSANPESNQECYVRTSYSTTYTDEQGNVKYTQHYGWKKVNL